MSARLSVVPQPIEWDEEEALTDVVSRDALTSDSGIWKVPELESRPVERPRVRSDAEIYAAYSPIVRRIAMKAVRTLPRSIALDDIVSAGWVGMSEAIRRRPDDMPEEQFEAYACYRIRGAILDYLRALDPLSRRLRGVAREVQAAQRALTNRLGRAPREDELAKELKMPLATLQKHTSEIQDAGFDRLDLAGGYEAPSLEPSPEHQASRNEMIRAIVELMEELPERLQIVLSLHYQHECSLREIGEILGVTESRVCQLHGEAVFRIKSALDGRPQTKQRRRRVAGAR